MVVGGGVAAEYHKSDTFGLLLIKKIRRIDRPFDESEYMLVRLVRVLITSSIASESEIEITCFHQPVGDKGVRINTKNEKVADVPAEDLLRNQDTSDGYLVKSYIILRSNFKGDYKPHLTSFIPYTKQKTSSDTIIDALFSSQ